MILARLRGKGSIGIKETISGIAWIGLLVAVAFAVRSIVSRMIG